MLLGLKKRLKNLGIGLEITDSAMDKLLDEGYDFDNGARPLKRIIQRRIEDKLSEQILLGNIKNNSIAVIDYDGEEFIYTSDDWNAY